MKKCIFIIALAAMAASCEHKNWQTVIAKSNPPVNTCDTNKVISYANDIVPIMNTSCGALDNNCHTSGTGSGSTILDQWVNVNYCATAQGGVYPYKLISSIIWDGNASNMPKNGSKLAPCDIMKIQRWVNQGAPNN